MTSSATSAVRLGADGSARHCALLRHAGGDDVFHQPSLPIPCFAERHYGGVLNDEMLMALPPEQLGKAIAGMEAMAKNGFRYPFAQYGIQQDVRAGMPASYPSQR